MPQSGTISTPRVLFCSPHSYLDPSSGAALSTRDLLEMLVARGGACGVLCGSRTDFAQKTDVAALLSRCGVAAQVQVDPSGGFRLYHFVHSGVPVTVHEGTADGEGAASLLAALRSIVQLFQPEVLLTYGGDPLSCEVIRLAKQLGLRVVFQLLNDAYHDRELFRSIDAVLVHSDYARSFYHARLGIESFSLPSPIVWDRVRCMRVEPRCVTFVNPQPGKGVAVFARVALEMARKRPEIPLLVVEGRGRVNWLGRCGLDLSPVRNLRVLPNTPDPREFYRVSAAVLVPSLAPEMFGRVAAEAMLNGIPVLACNRGGLAQTVGDAGLLFDLPARYDGRSLLAPTAEEVVPWVQSLERIWDDPSFRESLSRRGLDAAQAFHPDRLAPRYHAFFRAVADRMAPTPFSSCGRDCFFGMVQNEAVQGNTQNGAG